MASDTALPTPDALGAVERRARARAVAEDLSAIFGEARAVGPAPAAAKPVTGRRVETHGRLSAASLGALGAAALAGIAAGVLMVRAPARPARPAPAHPAALPVQLVPPVETPLAADAAQAAPPPVAETPEPETRAVRPAPVRADVMAADRRLRAAYAAAIRAGVSRRLLADERDLWAGARRRHAGEPARLVASYRDIAGDLESEAARARGRAARSERHSMLHPRFPAWWR